MPLKITTAFKCKTLHDVLAEDVQDLYSAQTSQLKALDKMARAVSSQALGQLLSRHLTLTQNQVTRLETVAKLLELSLEGKYSNGMMGIILDMEMMLRSPACAARDIQLVCVAQKIKNYELVVYASACTLAQLLKFPEAAKLLQAMLAEETAAKVELGSLGDYHHSPHVEFTATAKELFKQEKAS